MSGKPGACCRSDPEYLVWVWGIGIYHGCMDRSARLGENLPVWKDWRFLELMGWKLKRFFHDVFGIFFSRQLLVFT